MSMTASQARDEVLAMFKTALEANAPAALGYTPQVVWEDVTDTSAMPQDKAWIRATVDPRTISGQATMGERGNRRFSREGIVWVQLFVPNDADRVTVEDKLAKIATDAFEGEHTPGGAWFRAIRTRSIGLEGAWNQTNVVGEFTYDEIK